MRFPLGFRFPSELILVLGGVAQAVLVPQSTICNGMSDTGPGGMFGYSISLSSASGNNSAYTWMAVGKPWDSSVHVYAIKNPDRSYLYNATAQMFASQNLSSAYSWVPVIQLNDTNNGTFGPSGSGLSLFGYSVSLTQDGAWLAVGIPGRQYVTTTNIQDATYSGAVRLFRRSSDSVSSLPGPQYTYIAQVANPNTAPRFWQRFGSKVVIKTRPNTNDAWLITSTNGGWDGAKNTGSITSSSDVSRNGIYVYRLINYGLSTFQASWTTALNSSFQFIKTESKVPLGSLGHDFEVIETGNTLTLLVRDYVIPPDVTTTQYEAACPSLTCSFITIDGRNISSVGAVIEYRLNMATARFEQTGVRMYSNGFEYDSFINVNSLNAGYLRTDWRRYDWFGVGITAARDTKFGRWVSVIGAPRDGTGVFSFLKPMGALDSPTRDPPNSVNTTWSMGQYLMNHKYWRRTFFGQKVALSPDARFLVVADASGTADSLGRGQAYLYRRTADSEQIFPRYLMDNIAPGITSRSPLTFDLIGTYAKSPVAPNVTVFQADQFGFGMAVNQHFVILAAPAEQCLYTFPLPISEEKPTVSPPPTPPIDYTISVPPAPAIPTITPEAPIATQSAGDAWGLAILVGIGVLVVLLPILIFALIKRHREQTLKALKAAHDLANAEATLSGNTTIDASQDLSTVSPDKVASGVHLLK